MDISHRTMRRCSVTVIRNVMSLRMGKTRGWITTRWFRNQKHAQRLLIQITQHH